MADTPPPTLRIATLVVRANGSRQQATAIAEAFRRSLKAQTHDLGGAAGLEGARLVAPAPTSAPRARGGEAGAIAAGALAGRLVGGRHG